jgi:hypothetical protein
MDGLDALAGLALPHQGAMLEKHGLLQSIFIENVMLGGSARFHMIVLIGAHVYFLTCPSARRDPE